MTCHPDSGTTVNRQPGPMEIDTARELELIATLLAEMPIVDRPAPTLNEREMETGSLDDGESWYELPVLAPPPQKKRDRPRTGSRKRTAPERRQTDADRVQTAASPTERPLAAASSGAVQPRTDEEPAPFTGNEPVSELSSKAIQMPSAKDILASHEARRKTHPVTAPAKQSVSPLAPTLPRPPDQWALPAWVAGPPVAAVVLVVGLASGILSWWWAGDSYAAALISERLIVADSTGRRMPLPETVRPPGGSWIRSTAEHLARWAIFMSFVEPGQDPLPGEVAALSSRALEVSPLNPTARLTLAQLGQAGSDGAISPTGLGLSRDAASLTWCARRLLAAGNKQEALQMYVSALVVLTPAEPFRAAIPRFSDDPNVPRYLLPGEERQREILRELVANESAFPEWSTAIPKNVATSLAVARLLKETNRREADALLDFVTGAPIPLERSTPASAVALAARAEAFAMKSRWKEAEQDYRLAIEAVNDEKIKRSWWFNLADIELRLNDETQWQSALRAAMAVSPSDEIAQHATSVQRARSGRPLDRATNARAN